MTFFSYSSRRTWLQPAKMYESLGATLAQRLAHSELLLAADIRLHVHVNFGLRSNCLDYI